MSHRWHILCDTCGVKHHFDEANHEERMMLAITARADEIAGAADMLDAIDGEITMGGQYRIEHGWFRTHLGHELIPIDEYGRRSLQCQKPKVLECAAGHTHPCGLENGHEGPCQLTRASNPYARRG